jgi:hypothetical protein
MSTIVWQYSQYQESKAVCWYSVSMTDSLLTDRWVLIQFVYVKIGYKLYVEIYIVKNLITLAKFTYLFKLKQNVIYSILSIWDVPVTFPSFRWIYWIQICEFYNLISKIPLWKKSVSNQNSLYCTRLYTCVIFNYQNGPYYQIDKN